MAVFHKLRPAATSARRAAGPDPRVDCTTIAAAPKRVPTTVYGTVRSIRIQPQAGVATVIVRIDDGTAELMVTFLGRRRIGGIEIGRSLVVTGVIGVGLIGDQMLNPVYRLLP